MGKSKDGGGPASRARPADPVKITPELIEDCLEALSSGITLTAWSKQKGHPARRSVMKWLRRNPEYNDRFTAARDEGFDALAEGALDILDSADTSSKADVAKARAQFDGRLRLLSKWCTARYGDKLQIGGDGGEPIKMSHGERADRINRILALGIGRTVKAKQLEKTNGHTQNGTEG